MATNIDTRLRNAVQHHNCVLNGLGGNKSDNVSSWQHNLLKVVVNKKRIILSDLVAYGGQHSWSHENELLAVIKGLRDIRAGGFLS